MLYFKYLACSSWVLYLDNIHLGFELELGDKKHSHQEVAVVKIEFGYFELADILMAALQEYY